MQLQQYTYNKKTYIVDYRLNQFRTIGNPIQFIAFDSDLGEKILTHMIRNDKADYSQLDL